MGNYYSTPEEPSEPEPSEPEPSESEEPSEPEPSEPEEEPSESEEPSEPEKEIVDIQPTFDPDEIFHPSAFTKSPCKITNAQYSKVINFCKNNRYVRCNFCGYLTLFATYTKGGRFTHPPRDTLNIIKDPETREDVVYIDCKTCNYDIKVVI